MIRRTDPVILENRPRDPLFFKLFTRTARMCVCTLERIMRSGGTREIFHNLCFICHMSPYQELRNLPNYLEL